MKNETSSHKPPPWKNPDDIITLAEEATEPPPLPKGGIPKQKVPGWIRWPIRVLFLSFVLLAIAAQRFARFFFRPPYKQEGRCKQMGVVGFEPT